MTPEQFEQKLRQNREALKQAIRRTIPVKMGNAAERHFKDNFRKGGFVDGSLHRWKPSKRIGKAKGAAGSYKTLLSGRNHLYNSVRHRVEPARAVVYNKVEYAAVHNEGLRAGRISGWDIILKWSRMTCIMSWRGRISLYTTALVIGNRNIRTLSIQGGRTTAITS